MRSSTHKNQKTILMASVMPWSNRYSGRRFRNKRINRVRRTTRIILKIDAFTVFCKRPTTPTTRRRASMQLWVSANVILTPSALILIASSIVKQHKKQISTTFQAVSTPGSATIPRPRSINSSWVSNPIAIAFAKMTMDEARRPCQRCTQAWLRRPSSVMLCSCATLGRICVRDCLRPSSRRRIAGSPLGTGASPEMLLASGSTAARCEKVKDIADGRRSPMTRAPSLALRRSVVTAREN
mmetsp:Transcript_11300/g.25030  ORF Transcript_11300/g.25030 Transcript_11300/m.25030 type:complete len:240 (-) Transcript_11300:129-848(-)